MRRALSEASTAVLAAGLALFVVGLGNPALQPWLIVIAGVWLVALVVKIVALAETKPRRRGQDFLQTWRSPQMWELERTGKTVAHAIVQLDGIHTAPNFEIMGGQVLGEMQPGERKLIGVGNDDGANVGFHWREGDRRFYSKSAHVARGTGPFVIEGIEWHSGDMIQT
jgi:hypothetical protein